MVRVKVLAEAISARIIHAFMVVLEALQMVGDIMRTLITGADSTVWQMAGNEASF